MHITLDGVMEDPYGWEDFNFSGWIHRYWNDGIEQFKNDELSNSDALILGRHTFESLAHNQISPYGDENFSDRLSSMVTYVASTSLKNSSWDARVITGNLANEVTHLKNKQGKDLLLLGSGELAQTLIQHELIDEYRLLVYPLILGRGKKLFQEGTNMRMRLKKAKSVGSDVTLQTYTPEHYL
jgi:dihydrofolate reductase